ncbi:hypothetical protein FAES_pFAES01122 (plasmid) [Fibrella aestuarina BUZ 2]|uniref:Uncharacterized protein n=1 Tax=Fibrella aestuarina BUZ 2 TaxID=1166018 RepID=I0KHK9_9BACT|nr:hypothetical protein [Fibrella aestuarina]CCH03612.1 hypothetical protein FAES_pFAES01122 [Fibrella aestuarina BUZ 2]
MQTEDNVLLTPTGHQFHLHARDGIRSVRIDRVVSENDLSFAHYPALSLSVYDEANFLLRSEELHAHVQPGEPSQAHLSKTFALWESLTIGIDTHGEAFDFLLRVYYTINPD